MKIEDVVFNHGGKKIIGMMVSYETALSFFDDLEEAVKLLPTNKVFVMHNDYIYFKLPKDVFRLNGDEVTLKYWRELDEH